jgi:hypothetical protein
MSNEDNEPEYVVYETARIRVEEGFYSIEYLEKLVKNFKEVKAVQDQHLLQSMVTRRMIHLAPKREWVGLSEKDFEVFDSNYGFDGVSIARTVEALLRGKNGG